MSDDNHATSAKPITVAAIAHDRDPAVIGATIVVRGEVGGDEDLTINGRLEGSVSLPKHRVVIGKDGRVHANVHANVVEVHGMVEGDLRGDSQVTVRNTGNVAGNITAPQVSIEPGSRFRGSIDMDVKPIVEGRKGMTKPIIMPSGDRGHGSF